MSKVYIVIVMDPGGDSWIGGVYATRGLAYKEAAEQGEKEAQHSPKMHLIEEASDEDTLLFGIDDERPYLNRRWLEFTIYEFEVKEAETDG